MSVTETENDPPRFFVGGEDGDELLDPDRSSDFNRFYDHAEEEEEEYDSPPERQIVVGICSMAKKSKSKPMKEILERLSMFKYIMVVIFEEDVILNEAVENWPLCDCLISFHSKGFPLDKAVAYAKLRNPFVINDLNMQYHIQDRREVYGILKAEGILLPRYAVLNRDPNNPQANIMDPQKIQNCETKGRTYNYGLGEDCGYGAVLGMNWSRAVDTGNLLMLQLLYSKENVHLPSSTNQ